MTNEFANRQQWDLENEIKTLRTELETARAALKDAMEERRALKTEVERFSSALARSVEREKIARGEVGMIGEKRSGDDK